MSERVGRWGPAVQIEKRETPGWRIPHPAEDLQIPEKLSV